MITPARPGTTESGTLTTCPGGIVTVICVTSSSSTVTDRGTSIAASSPVDPLPAASIRAVSSTGNPTTGRCGRGGSPSKATFAGVCTEPMSTRTIWTSSGIWRATGLSRSRFQLRAWPSETIHRLRGPRAGEASASPTAAARSAVPGSGSTLSSSVKSRFPSPRTARWRTRGSIPARTTVTKSAGPSRPTAARTASRPRWRAELPSVTSPVLMPASRTKTTSFTPLPKSVEKRCTTGRDSAPTTRSTTAVRSRRRSHSMSLMRLRSWTYPSMRKRKVGSSTSRSRLRLRRWRITGNSASGRNQRRRGLSMVGRPRHRGGEVASPAAGQPVWRARRAR